MRRFCGKMRIDIFRKEFSMEIAVITGASSGIGKEFALAIDREYRLDEIWLIARRKERLAELASELRTNVRILDMDLTEKESLERYRALLEETSPEIKLLVNNAGTGLFGMFGELDLAEQLTSIDLNDRALTAMCWLSLPYMQRGDTIINMGSNSSWQPVPFENTYAATKAFVLSFSRGLGKELAPKGIHVMCVCPGWVETEFIDHAKVDDTITYFDRWYSASQVVEKAMKDLRRKRKISILGLPVRLQVALIKFLPAEMVMNIWVKQQKH